MNTMTRHSNIYDVNPGYYQVFSDGTNLYYNNASNIATAKTFVIDHPKDQDKYLVHACLEGPEAGVYYRGTSEITNGDSVIVQLPDYVDAFARDLTVQVTPISSGIRRYFPRYLEVSKVQNNQFTVFGENGEFFWVVYGKRTHIESQPFKRDVQIKGDGPYKWI